jgi:hypothetical protein
MNRIKNQTNIDDQSGVTLLLSVLILAGMFIITVTVTFFAIQELRASRANQLTEPAIVAAETSGEQGVWLIKRNYTAFTDTCPADDTTQVDGTTSAPGKIVTTRCVTYDKALFQLGPSEAKDFYLYDPADINGNLCMNADNPPGGAACDGGQLYKKIEFSMASGSFALNAAAVTVDGQTFVGSSVTVPTSGSVATITIPDPIPGAADERLRVTVTNPSSSTSASVNVTTSGGVLTGLPDYPTVDATGCSALVNVSDCDDDNSEIFKRRINVTVPR